MKPRRAACILSLTLGLAALAALAGCATAPTAAPIADSPEARAEWASKLARIAAEHGQFDQMLDEGAELARRAGAPALELALERPLDEAERDRMRQLLRELIAEFVTSERWQAIVAAVYAEDFTADELARVHAFYDSPLGSKIVQSRAPLNERIKADSRAMFDERLEEFIERADAELLAEFGAGIQP